MAAAQDHTMEALGEREHREEGGKEHVYQCEGYMVAGHPAYTEVGARRARNTIEMERNIAYQ